MDPRELIRRAGGPVKLAEAVGRDRTTVLGWKTIPPQHVEAIEKTFGIPRRELRPDLAGIFGAPTGQVSS